jgi:hypothetical protein
MQKWIGILLFHSYLSLVGTDAEAEHSPNGTDPMAPDGFAALPPQEQVTTVAEEADRLGNANLMRRFKFVVTAYIAGRVLTLFLPVFVTSGDENASEAKEMRATNWATVLFNILRYVLMGVLAWVFRVREQDTMYLPVGGDEHHTAHLDTAVSSFLSSSKFHDEYTICGAVSLVLTKLVRCIHALRGPAIDRGSHE